MAKFGRAAFVDAAAALRRAMTDRVLSDEARFGVEQAAEAMADLFQADSRGFNRAHFMAVVRGEVALGSEP